MTGHATRIGPLLGDKLEHGGQEVRNALSLILLKVVLLLQDVGQRPVSQSMDIAQFALPVENLLRPLARQAERLWKWPKQLYYLGYVIVIFAVFRAGLRVEQIVACDKLEYLQAYVLAMETQRDGLAKSQILTIAAILQTSVLAPHFAPSITSGDLYCLV